MGADLPGSAWVDGAVVPLTEARVPVTDRGFLFADSIFDTVRTYGAAPFLLGDHLDRLRGSAAALALPVPWSDGEIAAIVRATLGGRGFDGEAAVRIMVTRGDGGSGLALPEPTHPRLVVLCRPAPVVDRALREHGIVLARPGRARARSAVPAFVKSGAYLPNVLALHQGRERGGFEALLRGEDGSWSEATTSNLFAVLGGVVHTPSETAGILRGVTRAIVLVLCARLGLRVIERSLFDVDLDHADELFVTSSLKEVLPVRQLDDTPVGGGAAGPCTGALQVAFAALVEELQAQCAPRLADLRS